AAVVHSFREYRKDRAQESADALAAEAARLADVTRAPDLDRPLAGGRPSAPQD
ncbi:sulfite exporter TauE/SafE family protein, partial [Geodermatophilus sabuli]|nr:sulfite exporter TauE/SafE family protein [Geodermatophilus sabuli]